jgi:hypothetical protein
MKTMLLPLGLMMLLASCVFESPFETTAKVPVDQIFLGRWEEVSSNEKLAVNHMLVLQHSENEYLVQYPEGEKAMYFRAFAVDLAGQRFIQIQLIGTADDGPVKPENRKYHLLKVAMNKDALEIRTIKPEVLGKALKDTESLRAAFSAHKNEAELFGEPVMFRRMKDS